MIFLVVVLFLGGKEGYRMTSFTAASRKLPNGSQQIGRVANGSALMGYVGLDKQRRQLAKQRLLAWL